MVCASFARGSGILRHKIKDIPADGLVVDGSVPADLLTDAFAGMDVDTARTSARYHFALTTDGSDVLARGRVTAKLGLACDRCLGPATVDVDAPVELLFKPPGSESKLTEEEMELDEGPDIVEHDGQYLDLSPVIREQLILSVPMSVRCKDDCRGLCPACGQDRNVKDCGHGEQRAGSALEAQLAAWQEKHQKPE
jgi:uncharacterized protein